jgi:hypothetical protein
MEARLGRHMLSKPLLSCLPLTKIYNAQGLTCTASGRAVFSSRARPTSKQIDLKLHVHSFNGLMSSSPDLALPGLEFHAGFVLSVQYTIIDMMQ